MLTGSTGAGWRSARGRPAWCSCDETTKGEVRHGNGNQSRNNGRSLRLDCTHKSDSTAKREARRERVSMRTRLSRCKGMGSKQRSCAYSSWRARDARYGHGACASWTSSCGRRLWKREKHVSKEPRKGLEIRTSAAIRWLGAHPRTEPASMGWIYRISNCSKSGVTVKVVGSSRCCSHALHEADVAARRE